MLPSQIAVLKKWKGMENVNILALLKDINETWGTVVGFLINAAPICWVILFVSLNVILLFVIISLLKRISL